MSPSTPAALLAWIEDRRATGYRVTRVPLGEVSGWSWTPPYTRLRHHTGRFFMVKGYEVRQAGEPPRRWSQPLVDQPEIGLLGLLSVVEGDERFVLLQAKMEPGNPNLVQLSPTVQATRSNQAQVHAGRAPAYLREFVEADPASLLVDQLQSEQSSRFAAKRNRNVLLELPERVEALPGFAWVSMGHLRALLHHDETVNMDTRSVLSCLPPSLWGGEAGKPRGDFDAAFLASSRWRPSDREAVGAHLRWLSRLKSEVERSTEILPLSALPGWTADHDSIRPEGQGPFEVVGVDVVAPDREVPGWMQPLLAHHETGLLGWLVRRRRGEVELLCRAATAPGCRDLLELGPTVVVDRVEDLEGDPSQPFGPRFLAPAPATVRYDAIQSEEGGRFWAWRSRYLVVEVDEDPPLPQDHRWLRPAELRELMAVGLVAIEARNLLSCLLPLQPPEAP